MNNGAPEQARQIQVEAQADHLDSIARSNPINALAELIWNALDADADIRMRRKVWGCGDSNHGGYCRHDHGWQCHFCLHPAILHTRRTGQSPCGGC